MAFQLQDDMKVIEIFENSLKSVEIQEYISNCKLEISDLLIENYVDMVHISLAKCGKLYSGWMIFDLENSDEDPNELETINIGIASFFHSEKGQDQLRLYHENRLTGAFLLLRYLFQLFSGPIKNGTFLTGTTPTPEISQFLKDIFELDSLKACPQVTIFENGVSSKTMMDQILEDATGLKRLDLRCTMPDDWRNEKILNLPILISWPTEWFTTTDLLCNLNVECANLNETNLKWQSFKAFMLKWKQSEDTKLKMLEISFDGDWDGFNTDGLDLKPWDRKKRDSHYPDLFSKSPDADWMNCEMFCDIERPSGLLATYWRREQSFHFVVWHDPHPIATLNPKAEQLVKIEEDQFISDEEEEEEEDDEEEEDEEEEED